MPFPPVSHVREKHAGHRAGTFASHVSQECLQASHRHAHTVTRRCFFTRPNIGMRLPESKLDKSAPRCHILTMKLTRDTVAAEYGVRIEKRTERTTGRPQAWWYAVDADGYRTIPTRTLSELRDRLAARREA